MNKTIRFIIWITPFVSPMVSLERRESNEEKTKFLRNFFLKIEFRKNFVKISLLSPAFPAIRRAMNDKTILRFEQVTKIYGADESVYALDEINLEIERGETVAVVGVSGSGKSTLLNLACGLDVPTSGRVFFDGVDLSAANDDEITRLRRVKIGMIFQTFNLLPTLTALENVALTLRLQGANARTSRARAEELLERVNLVHRGGHLPDELSGGERQRVAIARALVFNPPLLLADEPTGNLDSGTGEQILEFLTELRLEFGTTIILVTHDKHAASHCERILTMLDGRIVKDEMTLLSSKAEMI
jgi:putative ABC transport system ATP-binding protein